LVRVGQKSTHFCPSDLPLRYGCFHGVTAVPFFRVVRQVVGEDDRATPSTMLFECQLPRPESVSAKRKAAIVKDVLALEDGGAEWETGNADVAASAIELSCLSVWFLYRNDEKD
jgi:hypothetical protein